MGKEKVIVLSNGAWLKKRSEIWLKNYSQALYSRPTLVTEKFMQGYDVFDINELDFDRVKNPYKL